MVNLQEMAPPRDLDWKSWVERWDRMQERYLVRRAERFETIVRLIRYTQPAPAVVCDFGCGTGSLMLSVLEAFPGVECVGFDFDPTLLWLARARLAPFAGRWRVVLADLREDSWMDALPSPADAAISATALHWFSPDQLEILYRRIARILRPGGILLSADHAGIACRPLQELLEGHRGEILEQTADPASDNWPGFWSGYARALGVDIDDIHRRMIGGWEGGVETGLPLPWHFDKLRESGFDPVDCFWRCDCDAIYGGLRGPLSGGQPMEGNADSPP